MNKLFILPVESIDTRYTGQMRKYLPEKFQLELANYFEIMVIDGDDTNNDTTHGAFLNFISTNKYKSTQLISLLRHQINDGDLIFALDAWNPTIIQLRYTLDLMGIKAKIAGFWHAGSYDPQDFLGRLIDNKHWSYNFERSLYFAIDYNFFATEFHIDMFISTLFESADKFKSLYRGIPPKKIVRAGLPLDYLQNVLQGYSQIEKEDIILFPHRVAPEKQPEIFRDLAKELPQYKFVVAQDEKLTKEEYHTLLGKSKIVFSANLQETLGISAYEGAIVGALPILPDRLSYHEMYPKTFMYPSDWTENFDTYLSHKEDIKQAIINGMTNHKMYREHLPSLVKDLHEKYFSSNIIIETFKGAKK